MIDVTDITQILLDRLKHANSTTQEYACVYALGELKIATPAVIEALIRSLDTTFKDDWKLRECYVQALSKLGWKPTTNQQYAWWWVIQKKYHLAVQLGEVAIVPLLCCYDKFACSPRIKDAYKALLSIGESVIPFVIKKITPKKDVVVSYCRLKAYTKILTHFGPHPTIIQFFEKQIISPYQIYSNFYAHLLSKLGWKPGSKEMYAYWFIATDQWQALYKLQQSAIPALLNCLSVSGPKSNLAKATLLDLGEITIPYFKEHLTRCWSPIQHHIIQMLAILAIVYSSAKDILIQGLHHPRYEVCQSCDFYLSLLNWTPNTPEECNDYNAIHHISKKEFLAVKEHQEKYLVATQREMATIVQSLHTDLENPPYLQEAITLLKDLNSAIWPVIPQLYDFCSVWRNNITIFALGTISKYSLPILEKITCFDDTSDESFLCTLSRDMGSDIKKIFTRRLVSIFLHGTRLHASEAFQILQNINWIPQTIEEKITQHIFLEQWDQLLIYGYSIVQPILKYLDRFVDVNLESSIENITPLFLSLNIQEKLVPYISQELCSSVASGRKFYVKLLINQIGLQTPGVAVALSFCLHDADKKIKKLCTEVLKKHKQYDIPSLIQGLHHPVSYVRVMCANTLRKLHWYPQTPKEKAWVALAKREWGVLRSLGSIALPPLLCCLNDAMIYFKEFGLHILSQIGTPAGIISFHLIELENINLRKYNIEDVIAKLGPIPLNTYLYQLHNASKTAARILLKMHWKPSSNYEICLLKVSQEQWDSVSKFSSQYRYLEELEIIIPIMLNCQNAKFPQTWGNLFNQFPESDFVTIIKKFSSRQQKKIISQLIGQFYSHNELSDKAQRLVYALDHRPLHLQDRLYLYSSLKKWELLTQDVSYNTELLLISSFLEAFHRIIVAQQTNYQSQSTEESSFIIDEMAQQYNHYLLLEPFMKKLPLLKLRHDSSWLVLLAMVLLQINKKDTLSDLRVKLLRKKIISLLNKFLPCVLRNTKLQHKKIYIQIHNIWTSIRQEDEISQATNHTQHTQDDPNQTFFMFDDDSFKEFYDFLKDLRQL